LRITVNVLDITIHVGLSQPKNGSQERYANLVKQLTARDNSVIVLEAAEFVDPQDATLATIYSYSDLKFVGRTLRVFRDLAPGFARSVIRILRENAVDLIQISHPSGAFVVKLATLLTASGAPLVYAPHNVESELVRETFSNDPRYTRIERFVLPRYIFLLELLVCRFVAQHVIAVSERDRDIIIRRFRLAPAKITVVPSGCSLERLPTHEEKARARREQGISEHARVIVFHGFYAYPPNREAFDLIERYLAPRLRTVNSNVLFLVGGTGAPTFERENVRSVGFIEDLPRFLAAGEIATVPIGAGSGTRLKIFQYMNKALPIVTTEKGIEGVSAHNGEHALIVPRVDERFIDQVAYLLGNERERARLGANARNLLEEKYTWDTIGAQLLAVYKRVLEGRHGS
jgi:glycosyltransferase involved in cell wall biosynthesis